MDLVALRDFVTLQKRPLFTLEYRPLSGATLLANRQDPRREFGRNLNSDGDAHLAKGAWSGHLQAVQCFPGSPLREDCRRVKSPVPRSDDNSTLRRQRDHAGDNKSKPEAKNVSTN